MWVKVLSGGSNTSLKTFNRVVFLERITLMKNGKIVGGFTYILQLLKGEMKVN